MIEGDYTPFQEEKRMNFNYKFSEYVKELDEKLWERAVDFAASMTKYPGVEFGQPGATG